jgi:hypothetical protein
MGRLHFHRPEVERSTFDRRVRRRKAVSEPPLRPAHGSVAASRLTSEFQNSSSVSSATTTRSRSANAHHARSSSRYPSAARTSPAASDSDAIHDNARARGRRSCSVAEAVGDELGANMTRDGSRMMPTTRVPRTEVPHRVRPRSSARARAPRRALMASSRRRAARPGTSPTARGSAPHRCASARKAHRATVLPEAAASCSPSPSRAHRAEVPR